MKTAFEEAGVLQRKCQSECTAVSWEIVFRVGHADPQCLSAVLCIFTGNI